MADISTELARILSAIYGEDVRGSIHDAIEKINDVSEVVLTTGTAVTSPSSSSTGFYDDSLYLNTDTFELWKCTGVNTWASQGTLKGEAGDDGNGIVSIEKTSTSGLIDTYTITYTDGDTDTFTVTNGEDGANGNKWYRGTGISGKAALPTVYTTSGVADANSGDMFLNPSEGAVYSCVTGGIPTVATWQYEMTLSGGGGGTSDYADLTNKPSINGYTLSGNQTGADLGLASSSDIPTVDQTYSTTSSNAQSGKAVASAISGKADTSLLKSTVGWTGKNLLKNTASSQTINGVTFTVNADGSVTVNGTATTNANFNLITNDTMIADGLLLSGCNGGSQSTYYIRAQIGSDYKSVYDGESVPLSNGTLTNLWISVVNGQTVNNLTFYPMLRDANIADPTFEPYHESVEEEIEQIYADNGVLGAKNLLPYPYADKAATNNGVTYTYDEDGVVTLNGTATATSWRTLEQHDFPNLKVGADYILSGCPEGGASDTYFLQLSYDNGTKSYKDTGNGVRFTNTGNLTRIQILVPSGKTVNNVTFHPMLRLASDPDDTYVPYAMTNKEITEELTAINNGLDDWTSTETVSSSGTVSFSGLNDSYGYKIYYTLPSGDSAYTFSKVTKTGSGTSVTLTYTTDAPSGTVCKLRILK